MITCNSVEKTSRSKYSVVLCIHFRSSQRLTVLHDAQHGLIAEPRAVCHEELTEITRELHKRRAVAVIIQVLLELEETRRKVERKETIHDQ